LKLRWSATSPYSRKVIVTAIETGLDRWVERIPSDIRDPHSDIVRDNPLGKIPALITEGGEVLYDSPVICEYLDSLHDGRKLFPPAGGARWTALRRQALADGITDAAVLRLVESRRPAAQQSPGWIEKQRQVIERGLDVLEEEVAGITGGVTIGHIAIGCALGYLDFRLAGEDWRPSRPGLARWYGEFASRPSMRETVPEE
jgi:glutathione S-transferase